MAILDDEPLTYKLLCEIGKGGSYVKKQQYEEKLKRLSEETMRPIMDEIASLDPNLENQTFDGGFQYLVDWYNINYVTEMSQNTGS